MVVDFSVAICTYNGAERLPEVLDQLLHQVGTEDIQWEVLVVNNNSSDHTAAVVSEYAAVWRKDCELRYVFEAEQGLAYARNRAILEARSSDLIGFLDDDNLPAENWVAEAYRFGQERPQVGAYGGIIHAKLDEPPPPYFNQIKLLLAVYDRGQEPLCYHRSAKPRKVPVGAGLVIRASAWKEYVPQKLRLRGRDEKGKSMLGTCEDLEAMYYLQNSQWEIWHNPKMELWHHIPSRRLEKEYLLKIARTTGMVNKPLRLARLSPWQRPLMPLLTPLYLLSDSYKVVSYYWQYKDKFPEDIGKACEFESKIGRVLSSFIKS